jgi:hypothetical protein
MNEHEKSTTRKWEEFISHANDDNACVLRPVSQSLFDYGLKLWSDEFTIKFGDRDSKDNEFNF